MQIQKLKIVSGYSSNGLNRITSANPNDGKPNYRPNGCAVAATFDSEQALTSRNAMELIQCFMEAAIECGILKPKFLVFISENDGGRALENNNGTPNSCVPIPAGTKHLTVKMEFGSRHDSGKAEAAERALKRLLQNKYAPAALQAA